jgi:hypothetical protein
MTQKQMKTYDVQITRVTTYATESATLRVSAESAEDAEYIAESKYDDGEIELDDMEVQQREMRYVADEVVPEEREDALLRIIRSIQAETTNPRLTDDDIIGRIQGYCKEAIELEKQASVEQRNTP